MQANQWRVARAGGVEAIVKCMTSFPGNSLVQLSALLCLIPLALDNPSLQAHVATVALPAVISALRAHSDHADVQAKGLVVLGVLGQVALSKVPRSSCNLHFLTIFVILKTKDLDRRSLQELLTKACSRPLSSTDGGHLEGSARQ